MEEQLAAAPVTEQKMSFSDKLMNVFAAPGALFEYVGQSEKDNSNWGVPLTVSMIFSILFTIVVFSQPPIQDQVTQKNQQTIEKRVADGKITQEQADQAASLNFAKPGSPMFLIFGSIFVVIFNALTLFVSALLYWLILKYGFKSALSYMKITEVVGLSMYIGAVGAIITMIMIVVMGTMHATPGLGLLISQFDDQNKVHKILEACNLVTFWATAVIGIGLSKAGRVSLAKGLGTVFGVWAVWTAISISVGSMFGG
jgi:hypothetical protein